jgi:ATP-dependent Lhr-like helicase
MRSPSGLALLTSGRYRGRPAGDASTGIRRTVPPSVVGRWSLVPGAETDATVRTHAAAEVLLDRHGIVTRGAVVAEGTVGGFAGVYRVLSALEETGRIRRGYFVEGLGAAQFASAGAVDRVRAFAARPDEDRQAPVGLVLAAADPANPYGAALPWPGAAGRSEVLSADEEPASTPGPVDKHRPARRAGALTVLVDGEAALYAERGGRSLLSFTSDAAVLAAAGEALAERVRSGRIGSLTITKIDGAEALTSAGGVVDALTAAGFSMTPRGLRLRAPTR